MDRQELNEAVEDAFVNGVKRHHNLEVRRELWLELIENGWLDGDDAEKHCGLAVDYSGIGRPAYYISVPEPKSLLPDR